MHERREVDVPLFAVVWDPEEPEAGYCDHSFVLEGSPSWTDSTNKRFGDKIALYGFSADPKKRVPRRRELSAVEHQWESDYLYVLQHGKVPGEPLEWNKNGFSARFFPKADKRTQNLFTVPSIHGAS